MKLIHLSDLHLGKRLGNFSMTEDQKYILSKITDIIKDEKPHAVLVSGDVYDRSVPSEEAVGLFDDFLVKISELNIPVFVISGNHDSPERISFASRLISKSGVYLSPVYDGDVKPVTLTDEYGEADIYMLPFIKPVHVKRFYPDAEINSYTDAVKTAADNMHIDSGRRNILLAHQFVTGAVQGGSEDITVGGLDNVDASVFEGFDYVALGHIHGAQNIGSEKIRYCGTPLKYSFSEANQEKSVTVAELYEKGNLTVRTIPLSPMRDMIKLRGSYAELTDKKFLLTADTNAYVHITLTDDEDIANVFSKLTANYPNLMKLDYDNARTRAKSGAAMAGSENAAEKNPCTLFDEFYKMQNGMPMTSEQEEYILRCCDEIWQTE